MNAKEYVQWRIDTGDRFLVNLHKDDRDLLASILEQYAALRQPPVSGQACDHNYVPIGCYEQNGRFICTKCKEEM